MDEVLVKICDCIPTLFSAIIGSLITILSSRILRKIEKTGKISLYCKFTHSKDSKHHPFEYDLISSKDNQIFYVPLWVELVNNSDVNKVCRNIGVYTYKKGKEVEELAQIQRIDDNTYYGDNGIYSFVVEANSVKRAELLYCSKDLNTDIDELIIEYSTEGNKTRRYLLHRFDDDWRKTLYINYKKGWFSPVERKSSLFKKWR